MNILHLILLFIHVTQSFADMKLEDLTGYNYHLTTGVPLAGNMLAAEVKEFGILDIHKIVGGLITDIREVPYQAGLIITVRRILTSVCGGCLISPTRVLTAAHCYHDGRTTAEDFTVVLGSNRIFSGGERIISNGIIVHADWDPKSTANDIGVVFIPPVNFTNVIQPISLPEEYEHQTFEGWTALASGYGLTKRGSSIPRNQRLRSVQLPVINNEKCKEVYGDFVTPEKICTSGKDGHGTCQGDSGGPLALDINGTRILIGLTSFGARVGCDKGYPAAYTRLTSYVAWIHAI